MAPTIEQVMGGIEARLATINGLRTGDHVPGQINPPQAFVTVPPMEYGEGMERARSRLSLTIVVMVSRVMDRGGQMKLASYANPDGASSIRAAVEGDRTLGGIVEDTRVTSFEPTGLVEAGELSYYGGEFAVQVLAD